MSQQDSFKYLLAKNLINAASEKFSADNPAGNKRKLLSLLHTCLIDEITDKKESMTEAGRISYLESKNKEAKTIFLLHGNSACNEFFINQFLALGDQYHLIAVDLPGHGDSDNAIVPTDAYSFSGYARCINEIKIKLNISTASIVGWSLGGHCALEMLRVDPNGIDSILITGTPPLKR